MFFMISFMIIEKDVELTCSANRDSSSFFQDVGTSYTLAFVSDGHMRVAQMQCQHAIL